MSRAAPAMGHGSLVGAGPLRPFRKADARTHDYAFAKVGFAPEEIRYMYFAC
jgi:hypothetical protein